MVGCTVRIKVISGQLESLAYSVSLCIRLTMKEIAYDNEAPSLELVEVLKFISALFCLLLGGKNFEVIGDISF